jgi:hypothetical protein
MHTRLLALLSALVIVAAASPDAGVVFRLDVEPATSGGPAVSKDAVMVVRSLCCDVSTVALTATAEGVVDGVRRSIPVRLDAMKDGGHAVARQWPDGEWVLHLTGTCAERNTSASTLVALDGSGFVKAGIKFYDRTASGGDVDAFLRDMRTRTE